MEEKKKKVGHVFIHFSSLFLRNSLSICKSIKTSMIAPQIESIIICFCNSWILSIKLKCCFMNFHHKCFIREEKHVVKMCAWISVETKTINGDFRTWEIYNLKNGWMDWLNNSLIEISIEVGKLCEWILNPRNWINSTSSKIKILKRTHFRIKNIQKVLLSSIPKWNYFKSMELKITRNHWNFVILKWIWSYLYDGLLFYLQFKCKRDSFKKIKNKNNSIEPINFFIFIFHNNKKKIYGFNVKLWFFIFFFYFQWLIDFLLLI